MSKPSSKTDPDPGDKSPSETDVVEAEAVEAEAVESEETEVEEAESAAEETEFAESAAEEDAEPEAVEIQVVEAEIVEPEDSESPPAEPEPEREAVEPPPAEPAVEQAPAEAAAPEPEVVVPPAPPIAAPAEAVAVPPVVPVPVVAPVPPAPYAAPPAPYGAPASPYAAAPAPPAPPFAGPVLVPVRAKDARRVPWGHAVVTALALAGLVLNIAGSAQFPGNAPVEQVMSFGISIDLVAVIIACTVGFWIALARPAARAARVFPWLGLALSAVVFVLWSLTAVGLYDTLFFGGRGRYMNDVALPFMLGIPWVLGVVFSAYGLRIAGKRHMNIPAIVGIALWTVVLAGVVASALLYGADLTD